MLSIGAVAYDPKVITIWEGFGAWFASRGLDTSYVLFRTYEEQVEALLDGQVDVAWNSPLAWIQTERRARAAGDTAVGFAMRDTDRDLTSVVLVADDSPVRTLSDLRGKRVAVGAYDSPQATLIPLLLLQEAGLVCNDDFEAVVYDVLPGKHGDHVGGERDAVRALVKGEVAAACILDSNQLVFGREGTLPAGKGRVVARSAPFDHCLFTGIGGRGDDAVARLRTLLLSMEWSDAEVRPLLELEGLRRWCDGRTTGFGQLGRAIDTLPFQGAETVRAFVGRT
jgi:ABC-type phosphate/phosphonate transport system substrate-binding protein